MSRFRRVTLITGASGGIGRVLARSFYEQGDDLILQYHRNRISASIFKNSRRVQLVQADLTQKKELKNLFQTVKDHHQKIDVFIHCAARTDDQLFIRMKESQWDQIIQLNLSAAFLCIKEAARLMSGRGRKIMINLASLSGITGKIGQANYAASKAGLIALAKVAAAEFQNIQVHTIIPGLMPTSMTKNIDPINRNSSAINDLTQFILMLMQLESVSGEVYHFEDRIHPVSTYIG